MLVVTGLRVVGDGAGGKVCELVTTGLRVVVVSGILNRTVVTGGGAGVVVWLTGADTSKMDPIMSSCSVSSTNVPKTTSGC